MSFEHPMAFAKALLDAKGWQKKPSLLLGNGFSMAWDPSTFGYEKLLDGIAPTLSPELRAIFTEYDTSNFEAIMQALERARTIAAIYAAPKSLRDQLASEVANLRKALIQAIHDHHPHDATVLSQDQRAACEAFLTPFKEIFTTNYDLLLYWVISINAVLRTKFTDAFGYSGPGTPLIWSRPRSEQTTHYLHGALHLATSNLGAIEKFQWTGTSVIMDEVEKLLAAGRLPLIVSEGTAQLKTLRINGAPYLRRCLRALARNVRPLFIFGFAFGEQDRHIMDAIIESDCREVYVGLHGGGRGHVKDCVDEMVAARARLRADTLRVTYFDSDSAKPWG